MGLKGYRSLDAWKVSMDLVDAVYRLTAPLPRDKKLELSSQFRRAAVSIPCNIAERYGRAHRGDYIHHLSFARGSVMEVETLLTIVGRRKMIAREQLKPVWNLSQDVVRLLTALINSPKKPLRRADLETDPEPQGG